MDAPEIAKIYSYFVDTSIATFELDPTPADEMERRIRDSIDRGFPYLVADNEIGLIGYAYAHQYRPRPAYDRTAEVSVYTKAGIERRGIASALYERLIPTVFNVGYHTILAGIALPNDASVRLHEKFGFRKVAHFSEVGHKFDRWIDVGFWQLTGDSDRSSTRLAIRNPPH